MTQSAGEIPKKIDRYEIIEAIGFGAMGAVYKAFDPIIKRPVAVKTLRLDVPPQSPDYKAFLERFATEARTAGRLSHPNIITLYDVGHTEDQIPWLAMEYVEGSTVAELLDGERLRPEVVVSLVSQIASALDYAHSEGVIHRDIKPSNVIVYSGEKVKVTDFGIAKLMDADITQSGLMMGTPSYMSPEQAMGEDLDGRTDIFSLGVVAFEMLSGQQPFPGNNVTSILYKLVHSDPIRPDDLEVLGLLPDKWHEVFSRVLAKDPVERFATAATFVEKLEHCLGSWFGSLEGETVIVQDGVDLLGALEDSDATVAAVSPVERASGDTALAEPAETETVDAAEDETVYEDTRTATLERDVSLLDGATATQVPSASDGEVPPVGDAEKTLYAGAELDETVQGADETVLDTKKVPAATIRLPTLSRNHYLAIGAGAFLLVAIVLVLALGGRDEDPAPTAVTVPPPPPLVAESGSLIVTTDPEGATVVVNGEEEGSTPLELHELPLGSYDVRIEREGFRTEELSAEITTEASRATLDVALRPAPAPTPQPAFVLIRSNPTGARVAIDGKDIGTTPLDRHRVRAGNRTVRIERDGFLLWEDTVRARSGRTVEVDAILTERPQRPAPTPDPTPSVATVPRVEPGTLVERGEPGVVNPKCVECPPVPYPDAARRNRAQGVVLLSFMIDENGAVQDLRVEESGGEIFDTAVTETVSRWRYQPATKHGVAVKMRWVQRFRFRQGR